MNYGFITRVCHIEAYDKATVNLANCGCATLFRKSMIDKIGGFDPNLWTDWEDHDLGYRVNIAGFKCVYTPLTKVLHLGGGIYLGLNDEREIRIIRNQLLTYVKNYEHRSLIPRLPLALAIIFMRKLIHGKQSQFFLGLANFFRMFSIVIQERKKVQKLRVVSDERIFSSCRVPEKQSLLKSLRIL
jgi:GT2 family glycosyltransferase